jgi:hypothetical protein
VRFPGFSRRWDEGIVHNPPFQPMGPLDWRHSFMVGYSTEKGPGITRTSLVRHTDDR